MSICREEESTSAFERLFDVAKCEAALITNTAATFPVPSNVQLVLERNSHCFIDTLISSENNAHFDAEK